MINKHRLDILGLVDRNMSFYHASTQIRKHGNKINAFQNSVIEWINELNSLELLVQNFYKKLFKQEENNTSNISILDGFPQIEKEHSMKLKNPFSKEEIQRAVFEMAPFKSLGNDGLHTGFYQHTWETVGDNLCRLLGFRTASGRFK